MGFSTYLGNKLLDHAYRNTAYTPPTTVYVALYTAAPTDAGGGTEVSGNSYTRIAATFGAPSAKTIANTGVVTFPTASGSWGTITHFGVMDALTSGNLLGWNAVTTSKAVGAGDAPFYPIGALTVTI